MFNMELEDLLFPCWFQNNGRLQVCSVNDQPNVILLCSIQAFGGLKDPMEASGTAGQGLLV